MNNSQLIKRAILNSLGVLIYVSLVATVLNNAAKIFGPLNNSMAGPIVFLMLFVFSALVTCSLVLGKPLLLYMEGLKKEGIKLFLYTGASLFVLLLLAFAIMILIR